jgi:hypothetical protein
VSTVKQYVIEILTPFAVTTRPASVLTEDVCPQLFIAWMGKIYYLTGITYAQKETFNSYLTISAVHL